MSFRLFKTFLFNIHVLSSPIDAAPVATDSNVVYKQFPPGTEGQPPQALTGLDIDAFITPDSVFIGAESKFVITNLSFFTLHTLTLFFFRKGAKGKTRTDQSVVPGSVRTSAPKKKELYGLSNMPSISNLLDPSLSSAYTGPSYDDDGMSDRLFFFSHALAHTFHR